MPLYDQNCPNCGVHEVLCRTDERLSCLLCSAVCTIVPGIMHPQGIIFANAETNRQLGVTWETNKEKREWHRRHPNAVPVSKDSVADRDFKQSIRDRADKVIKHHGYKDVQEFKADATKQKNYKRGKTLDTAMPK